MRFRVVLVPFPFDDLTGQKVRPAVCLTDAIGPHRHVVVAFITSSSAAGETPSDIALPASMPEFALTGLRVSSTLRLHRMVTISAGVIQRSLGSLPPSIRPQVTLRLRALFAI